mgnify:CR=1 FL=1
MSYVAPVKDMLFNIRHLAQIDRIAQMPGFEDAGFETAQAVLEEAAKFNEGVLAPLNWEGDKYPSSFHDGKVTTTPGFKEAYRQYTEGGWQGLQHPAEFGGQGLPHVIDVRNFGMVGAIELEPIAGRPAERAFAAYLDAFASGLLIRTTGDIIALSPPLIISEDEIGRLAETLRAVLQRLN